MTECSKCGEEVHPLIRAVAQPLTMCKTCFRKGMRGHPFPVAPSDHTDRNEYLENLGLTVPEDKIMDVRYFARAIGIQREGKLRLQFVGDPMHWQMYKQLKEILLRYEYVNACVRPFVVDRAKAFIVGQLVAEVQRLLKLKKFFWTGNNVWEVSSFREKEDQVNVLMILWDQCMEELERCRDRVFQADFPPTSMRRVKDAREEGSFVVFEELRERYADALGEELLEFARCIDSFEDVNSLLPAHLHVVMKTSEKLEWVSTGFNALKNASTLVGWIGKFAEVTTAASYVTCFTSAVGVGFDVFHYKKDSKHLENLQKMIEIMTGPDLSIAHGDPARRQRLLDEILADLAEASQAHEVTITYPEEPDEKVFNPLGIEIPVITKEKTVDKKLTMADWYEKYAEYGGKVDWSQVQDLEFHTASLKRGKNLRVAKIIAGSIGATAAVAAIIFTGGAAAIVIAGVGVAAAVATNAAAVKRVYDWTDEFDRRWLTAACLLEAAKADVLKTLAGTSLADAVSKDRALVVRSTARDQLKELKVIDTDEELLFLFFSDGFMSLQYKLAQKLAAS